MSSPIASDRDTIIIRQTKTRFGESRSSDLSHLNAFTKIKPNKINTIGIVLPKKPSDKTVRIIPNVIAIVRAHRITEPIPELLLDTIFCSLSIALLAYENLLPI